MASLTLATVVTSIAAIAVSLTIVIIVLACYLARLEKTANRQQKSLRRRRASSTKSTSALIRDETSPTRSEMLPKNSFVVATDTAVTVRPLQSDGAAPPTIQSAARPQRFHQQLGAFQPALQPLEENRVGEHVYHVLETPVDDQVLV